MSGSEWWTQSWQVTLGLRSGEIITLPKALDAPLHWRKPRRVFINSMGDLFHPAVPDEFIAEVMDVVADARCDQHKMILCTKRPDRMAAFWSWHAENWPTDRPSAVARDVYGYLPNLYLMTTVEHPDQLGRIGHLLRCPAAMRGLSVEPMLGPIDVTDGLTLRVGGIGDFRAGDRPVTCYYEPRIDWLIVGGETGSGRRPCNVEWIRSVVRQCDAAGVPVYVKALGANVMMRCDSLDGRRSGDNPEREWPEGTIFGTRDGYMSTQWQGHSVFLRDRNGADPSEWPTYLCRRDLPAGLRLENDA